MNLRVMLSLSVLTVLGCDDDKKPVPPPPSGKRNEAVVATVTAPATATTVAHAPTKPTTRAPLCGAAPLAAGSHADARGYAVAAGQLRVALGLVEVRSHPLLRAAAGRKTFPEDVQRVWEE